jgi:hypothetical protein
MLHIQHNACYTLKETIDPINTSSFLYIFDPNPKFWLK